MKKIDVTQPYAMSSPFADGVYSSVSTSDFEIPADTSTAPDDTCVIDDGFLPITSTDLDDGGIAPERKNFNGMFYLSTDQRFYLQNGGFITYNSNVATAIGGYPQDAVLGYIDGQGTYKLVRSLIDDNTNDFTQDETLIDGEHWEEIPMGGGGSGYQLFDIVMKDHVLDYAETLGLAPLGTYVYKEAIAGTRYGYPDFYQKCVDEYNDGTSAYMSSNITVVGSLTNNDGIISGFSLSNWGYAGAITISSGDTWEYVMKFKVPSFASNQNINSFGNEDDKGMGVAITTSGALAFWASSNGSTWDIADTETSVNTLVANTDYYIRTYFTGEAYKVDVSTTGAFTGEEINYITHTSSTSIHTISTTPIDIGGWNISGSNVNYVLGSIDLNSCYININGTRWWTGTNTCKEASNKHRFYDIADKATFDNMYAITGEAWYYGIDTTNERVFLPRSTRFKNGTTSDVGGYQAAGLPNITGTVYGSATDIVQSWGEATNDADGCFDNSTFVQRRSVADGAGGNAPSLKDLIFNASLSSSIYGASDTVEYSSTKLIPYMVVGNIANVSAATDVVDVTTTENDTLPLGFSTYQGEGTQPSPAWLKSSGQWNSGEVYATFYNYYVTKIGDDFGAGKVVENTDPYTDYDLVINQTEQTFRLPLYNGQESMFADKVKGNGFALGLQNSDGTDCVLFSQPNDYNRCSNGMPTGATAPVAMTNTETTSWAGIGGIKGVSTDSSKSGIVVDTENITIPTGMALFYKVANAVQNLELLDAGAVLTAVNNVSAKVDNTIHIIETYENGSSGYIVYSNGLCEQWGIRASGAGVQTLFIKTYKDKNYNLLCEPVGQSGQVQNARPMEYNKQPDGFYSYYSDTYYSINWRTCGYLAEGQY